ncbi:MAG: UDP-N-acetylglucosamine 2-epimerase (non-hydrolyzing) [Acidobacteria bacterium]|nr:UDP-N-acetylglucosamine 2-epimerase (non-hydrolyzing) [Acidobacteriota bacterium]
MRILSIVGARPQFVKAAVICGAIARDSGTPPIEHRLLHTGQHYDDRLSDVFFHQLRMPQPAYNLEVGSGKHGQQSGEMIRRIEPVLESEEPDWVLLYGDTNSTLAGAIAAAKLGKLRIAHLEAGLRSFNRSMPEEINRVVADHLSHLLLCPTETAMRNLKREGLRDRAVLTGDVMFDAVLGESEAAEAMNSPVARAWREADFALATVHRQENTDQPERLWAIMKALEEIARTICPVLLPLHPRTRKFLGDWKPHHVTISDPLSYHEMLVLEHRARLILTDSGGVQKEAYFAKTPCITLRDETEWVETLENGCNVVVGAHPERILEAARNTAHAGPWKPLYGDGNAAGHVLAALRSHIMLCP